MSIDLSGFGTVMAKNIMVEITGKNPLVQLANVFPGNEIVDMVLPDLKATTQKRKWYKR